MPVLETERRKNHINLIDPNHALLPITTECLKYQERERPSSEELCQRLAGLKDSHHYRDNINVRQHQDEIQAKDRELEEKDRVIQEKERALQDKERVIQDKERALQDKERVIQEKERELQDKDTVMERVIQDKDRVIASREEQFRQLNQQLEEQEQEIQHSLQRQQPQQQLSQQVQTNPDHKPHPPKEGKVTLNWRDGGKAPFGMARGSAVVDGGCGLLYALGWSSMFLQLKKQ